jgi:hypothetical protein
MRAEGEAPHVPAPQRDGVLLAVLALVAYALLGQRAFYKTDGPDLVWLLHQGNLHHPWHVGYLPLFAALRACLEWTGISLIRLGDLFSAIGVALAVYCVHAAERLLGTPRTQAMFAALLLALSPGCLLFATVVEFHGPLLGAVGVCTWWTARCALRPRIWSMLVLGVLTHGAFLMHGSAIFLPMILLPWFLAMRRQHGPWTGQDWALAVLAGLMHSALFLMLPRLWPSFYGDYADFAAAAAREGSTGRPQSLDWTPQILWQEWLLPLLPLSVAFLPALRRKEFRLEALALLVGFLPFLYICVRQLVDEPEHGAYLLPLLPLAARLTAAVWGNVCLTVMVLGSAAGGLYQLFHLQADELGPQSRWYQDVLVAAGGAEPYVLIDTHRELCWAYATLRTGHAPTDPRCQFVYARPVAMSPRAALAPAHLDGMVKYLLHLHQQGRALVISSDTIRALEDPRGQALREKSTLEVPASTEFGGPLYLDALRNTFVPKPAGPTCFRLEPK